MSDEERLKWLKEIEKDIFVCSLESTFVEDAKSCAIHSAIETLENQKIGHWIEMGQNKDKTHNVICSKCKARFKFRGHANSIYTQNKYRFCSYCGARMEGDKQ